MTSQFSPGKDLRKGDEECVTSEKSQGQREFPVSKTFFDHKRTKLCFNQYLPQHTQRTHRQAPQRKQSRNFLQEDEFIHNYWK